jgi:hypothetical protein
VILQWIEGSQNRRDFRWRIAAWLVLFCMTLSIGSVSSAASPPKGKPPISKKPPVPLKAKNAKKKPFLLTKSKIAQALSPPEPLQEDPSLQGKLWRSGRFRGANVSLDLSRDDLVDLIRWGANVARVTLGDDAVETEPPYRLMEPGLQRLDRFLDAARDAGIKVVLTFHTAPARRDANDPRLWEQPEAHLAFAKDWMEIAKRYRGNTTLVAYDLLSEPDPEIVFNGEHPEAQIAGTTADWNILAKRLTLAIRGIDPDRPLIVESGAWAYARGFEWLKPTGDANTIYSFYMFSPHKFTHQESDEPLRYPGTVPGHVEPEGYWDKKALLKNLEPAFEFADRYDVPIFVGEFGAMRTAPGADQYVKDLLLTFEKAGWHWAFWSFRDTREWNPELGRQSNQYSEVAPSRAPVMRLYKEFLSLNDHSFLLQDLPLLKDDDWVEPMRAVHQNFSGRPGDIGLFGDSITYGHQFYTPLFANGYTADLKTLWDLRRFKETIPLEVADWKTPIHGNQSGWRITNGLPKLAEVLRRDNPEIAFVMFGTNDLNDGPPAQTGFEDHLRRYLEQVMGNGTVPILSTLPPKKDKEELIQAYNGVILKLAHEMNLPLMDYYGAVMRRRPHDWYRTLIIGDKVHPSFPEEFQRDMTETGLRESGFTLRNYLALEATLSVLDRLRQP